MDLAVKFDPNNAVCQNQLNVALAERGGAALK
jgi:hypothetical protein